MMGFLASLLGSGAPDDVVLDPVDLVVTPAEPVERIVADPVALARASVDTALAALMKDQGRLEKAIATAERKLARTRAAIDVYAAALAVAVRLDAAPGPAPAARGGAAPLVASSAAAAQGQTTPAPADAPDDGLRRCIACGTGVADDAPMFADVNGGGLCAFCSPSVADLLKPNDGSFVDMETGEPLSAERLRDWYDRAIAAGAIPADSLARWP